MANGKIINAMYNGLEKLGFAGGRMLEPSAGVGRFIGAMPQALSGKVKSWTAVELDKVTGSIAIKRSPTHFRDILNGELVDGM